MKYKGHYIKRLSRGLYNECIKDKDTLKAIAMLIFLKENKKCSVMKDFTYKKISEYTQMSIFVVKKRISKLQELGLIKISNNKIILNKIRAPKSNVRLDRINMENIGTIELGLNALYIVEVQNRKEYVKSAVNLTDKVRNMDECKKAKSIQKQVLRRGNVYTDNGISYNYLSNKLHVSKKTISIIIKYGVSNKMFEKNRNYRLFKTFQKHNDTINAYNNLKNQCGKLRMIGNDLYIIKANTYSVLSSAV